MPPSQFPMTYGRVLCDIPNALVYIDDLLVHTDTHEKHLEVLDKVLGCLHKNHLKINLEKVHFRKQGGFLPQIYAHA
jgi:hypothetical protein